MRIIDLRNKQSANVQNAQAISRIMDNLGRAETLRQNRQRTTNVLQAMAAGGTPQDIARAASVEPQFDTGFQGFIQQLGARFAPNIVSPIEQQVARQGVTRAFQDPLITEQRQASIESTRALTEQRKRRTTRTGVSDLQKQWEFKRKQRAILTDRLDRAAASQNEVEKANVNLKIQKLDTEMEKLAKRLGPQAEVTGTDFDRIDLSEVARFRGIEDQNVTKQRKPNETIEQFLKRSL